MSTRVVAYCGDMNIAVPMTVAVASLTANNVEPIDLFIAQNGFSSEARAHIEHAAGDHSVHWLGINDESIGDVHLPGRLSVGALYRLFLPEMLPSGIERFVYLDTDTLVVGDISELFEKDLGHASAAAARDFLGVAASVPRLPFVELGLPPDEPYFNSGVLVIDAAKWRTLRVRQRCLQLLAKYRLPHADQCALNVVLQKEWIRLDPRWNVQSPFYTNPSWFDGPEDAAAIYRATQEPQVLHYVGEKPWEQTANSIPRASLWFQYLDSTTMSGWRPSRKLELSSAISAGRRRLGKGVRRTGRWMVRRLARAVRTVFGENKGRLPYLDANVVRSLYEATGGRVATGPFAGMRLLQQPGWGATTDFASKILGTYEAELHTTIEALCTREPQEIINLGCADGFYAVGMALRVPSATVVAVDLDRDSLARCMEAARLNQVGDRISTFQSIAAHADSIRDRSLWIVDIEGDEEKELSMDTYPCLRSASIVVECHDFTRPGVTGLLVDRFRSTHSIACIRQEARNPNALPLLARRPEPERWLAVSEGRPCAMHWLILDPL